MFASANSNTSLQYKQILITHKLRLKVPVQNDTDQDGAAVTLWTTYRFGVSLGVRDYPQ
jgi:hypothetical protein